MKKLFLLFLISFLITPVIFSQSRNKAKYAKEIINERGELYFSFEIDNKIDLKYLSSFISIDSKKQERIYAYVSKNNFSRLINSGVEFTPVYSYYENRSNFLMADSLHEMANWNRYPTHSLYVKMMKKFETDYPSICDLDTIGYSENGYPLLMVILSDNIDKDEDEPEFFWTSAMHGDELVTFPLTIRFIDYLLTNYNTNNQVTTIIKNAEIYINPLANPDGTYYNSQNGNSVDDAKRYNSLNLDLNRNFPRIDGTPTSISSEIQAMIDLADSNDFVMSANTHSGAELVNYPWDHWTTAQNPHADDSWFNYASWKYAGAAQTNSPSGYFTDMGGVTQGADWYAVEGTRQDYMTYFQNCREVTIELSHTKEINSNSLPAYWNYNYNAMLDYTEQVLYGLRGVVTDSCTGDPLPGVKVELTLHDKDNSEVYTSAPVGNYHRPLYNGTYYVTFSHPGYKSKSDTVTVSNDDSLRLDVQLVPDLAGDVDFSADKTEICEGEEIIFTNESTAGTGNYNWNFNSGYQDTNAQNITVTYYSSGIFDVNLVLNYGKCVFNELKNNYIEVNELPGLDFNVTNESLPGAADGAIELTVNGGEPPYYFNWLNQPDSSIIVNLSGGMYYVTVTDSNDCATSDSAEVLTITSINRKYDQSLEIYPNPSTGVINIKSEFPVSEIKIRDAEYRLIYNSGEIKNKRIRINPAIDKGLYIMEISLPGGEKYYRKMIVN